MNFSRTEATPRPPRTSGAGRHLPAAVLVLLHLLACGPTGEDASEGLSLEHGGQSQELTAFNGLSFNGLAFNGLSFNGLAFNGLSFNGLATAEFSTWFNKNPALNNEVMKYVIHCAVPAGQTRTYTDSQGESYTWEGRMGLAVDWSSGRSASEAEQQVVSACMAAHANKYGVSVSISVLGRSAKDQDIPLESDELSLYPNREACFFGNLFTNEGIYIANDGTTLSTAQSSPRMCGLLGDNGTVREDCAPMAFVGSCETLCTQDPTDNFYVRCSYNGKDYRPIVTRLRDADIYSCGDKTCQFTESCGTGSTYDSCKTDCGPCH